jgi:hypothetical protein
VSYTKKQQLGRRYASYPSLQSCPGRLRAPLCAGNYHDLDMANCHPVILAQVAGRAGCDIPELTRYVAQREVVLCEIKNYYGCTRAAAKELILRLCNGGGTKAWHGDFQVARKETMELITDLIEELTLARDSIIMVHPVVHDVLADINLRTHKKKNLWSAFSWSMHQIECEILDTIEAYLTKHGWQVDVLVFDGVMVRRQHPGSFDEAILRACETEVLAKNGLVVHLLEKAM